MQLAASVIALTFNANEILMRLWDITENVGYFVDDGQLDSVFDERDLGIIMQNNMKVSEQCTKVVGTANGVLV